MCLKTRDRAGTHRRSGMSFQRLPGRTGVGSTGTTERSHSEMSGGARAYVRTDGTSPLRCPSLDRGSTAVPTGRELVKVSIRCPEMDPLPHVVASPRTNDFDARRDEFLVRLV